MAFLPLLLHIRPCCILLACIVEVRANRNSQGGAALITGPQSTGGAVNFVTATPQEQDYHQIRTTTGAFGPNVCARSGNTNERSQFFYGLGRNGAKGFNAISGQSYGGFALNDGFF